MFFLHLFCGATTNVYLVGARQRAGTIVCWQALSRDPCADNRLPDLKIYYLTTHWNIVNLALSEKQGEK